MVLPQPHQGGLRGVAHLAILIHRGVAAQQGRPQQGLLNGVGEVRVRCVHDPPGGVQLPHRHPVLSQGAGLIGADDGHAAQALHRLQLADDGVLPRHLLRPEGQHDGDDGAESLRDGCHRQSHGEQEGVHHVFMANRHTDAKQNGANRQDDGGKAASEPVQTDLQGRLFLLRALQQGGDLAHFRVHTRGGHQEPPPAIGDEAAGEHHVPPIPQRRLAADGLHVLFHRKALPGEDAFIAFQAGALQQAAVGADRIPRLQHHHITGDHLPARYLDHMAVPQHLGGGGGHPLQTVQRRGGLHRLDGAQHRVHGDDRQNHQGALPVSQRRRHRRRQDQDHHQKIPELLQEYPGHAFLSPGAELVGAAGLQPCPGLRRRQALRPAAQLPEQLHLCLFPNTFLHLVHPFRQDAKRRGFRIHA